MDTQGGTQFRPGAAVFGADGDKVGTVAEIHPEYVVVEKGTFFPTDYYIPTSAIARVDQDGGIHLNVAKDEAVNQGWENPPDRLVEGTGPGRRDESYDPTYGPQGELTEAGREAVGQATGATEPEVEPAAGQAETSAGGADLDRDRQTGMDHFDEFVHDAEPAATAGLTGTTDRTATTTMASTPGFTGETVIDAGELRAGTPEERPEARASATTGEPIRVPMHEEEIVPVKRAIPLGAVRIEKEIVTEERTITVPVTEERIRITRTAPADGTGEGADAFEEEVIEIPIRGEAVEVTKRPKVAGEVLIEKETIQRTERVGDTVRREEVHFEEDVLDADRRTPPEGDPEAGANR